MQTSGQNYVGKFEAERSEVYISESKCSKKPFSYGQTEPIEVLGTYEAEIHCEASAKSCLDEFTVVNWKIHCRETECIESRTSYSNPLACTCKVLENLKTSNSSCTLTRMSSLV